MATVYIDVTPEFLCDGGLQEMQRHRIRLVGSQKNEYPGTVRLAVYSDAIATELDGRLGRLLIEEHRNGMEYRRIVTFEPVAAQ